MILGIVGDKAKSEVRLGGQDLMHFSSRGTQNYEQDTSEGPLYKPMAKLEAFAQASGINKTFNGF